MKMNKIVMNAAFGLLSLLGIVCTTAVPTHAQESRERPDAKLVKKAKITLEKARETALNAVPGTVESEELEMEGKIPMRKKLVYSFDIRNAGGTLTEIWVGAKTGKIVHRSEEDAAAEAKEKAKDEKANRKNNKQNEKDEDR